MKMILYEENEIISFIKKLNSLKDLQKNPNLIVKYIKFEEYLDNFSYDKLEK